MWAKYFMLFRSILNLGRRKGSTDSSMQIADYVKKAIRTEISAIALKIFMGIILLSAVIFSLFRLGNSFQVFLNQYQNSVILELSSFGAIALIGIALLYLLFKKPPEPKKAPPTDISNLAKKFIEGFVESFQ